MEHKKLVDYSKQVSEDAKSYVDGLRKDEADKKDKEQLSKMGLEGEPVNL